MSEPTRSLDALVAAAGADLAEGLQVVSAARLVTVAFDPSLALLVLRADEAVPDEAERGVLPGRHARRTPRAVLAALYPHDHPMRRLSDGGTTPIGELDDAELLRDDWLVPALALEDNLASPHGMAAISARLRAPDGCPWDRRQTHETLRPFVLEEAYETVDAIERGTPGDLAEELGDLFLQVILHAQLAAEEGHFDLTDVYRTLGAKIVRRHPHVFGSLEVGGVDEVLANWETIKAGERAERAERAGPARPGDPNGTPDDARGPFDGIARALPALPASREIQERASALGWDWPSVAGVWEKVDEELAELRAAGATDDASARLHELGDVLFAVVNLARWLKLDPEEALRAANRRWIGRFRAVEALAAERGLDLGALDLAGKDRLWDEVKAAAPRRAEVPEGEPSV